MQILLIFSLTLLFVSMQSRSIETFAQANISYAYIGLAITSPIKNKLTGLASLNWQNRIIITQTNSAKLPELLSLLQSHALFLQERKIATFIVLNDQVYVYTNNGTVLNSTLLSLSEAHSRLRDKHSILIGLDGGTKGVYDSLDLQRVFADIDAMPMRRSER